MELKLEDKVVFSKVAPPHGLYSNQGIDIYQNIKIPAGNQRLTAWLNDDVKVEGPIYKLEQDVSLPPERHLFVEFKPALASFDVY